MKLIFLIIAVLFSYRLFAKQTIQVAIVNSEIITKSELERATNILAPKTYFHVNITEEKREKVEKKALKKLIEKKLFFHFAQKNGISATKDEIDAKEKKIRNTFKNREYFANALKKSGLSHEEFKKELEVDIVMKKIYNKFIKTSFSDKDIIKYYKKNSYKFKEPEKIKMRVIYIKNDPTDPEGKMKARKKIQEAYKKIKSGKSFADMAKKYSDAMSRIMGGEIGYTHKGRFDKEVEKVAFSLEVGEMSSIIENDKGYYIVLVEGKKSVRIVPFKKVKERLKRELVAKSESRKKSKLLKKMQKNAKISIYAERLR